MWSAEYRLTTDDWTLLQMAPYRLTSTPSDQHCTLWTMDQDLHSPGTCTGTPSVGGLVGTILGAVVGLPVTAIPPVGYLVGPMLGAFVTDTPIVGGPVGDVLGTVVGLPVTGSVGDSDVGMWVVGMLLRRVCAETGASDGERLAMNIGSSVGLLVREVGAEDRWGAVCSGV